MSAAARAPTVLIAVGDELLSGHTQDTNSHFLAAACFAAGYPLRRIAVVPDDPDAIAAEIRAAASDVSITRIVVSGGIGPTPDDRTFEGVALALHRPLEENAAALRHISERVQRLHEAGWLSSSEISEGNRRSAMLPEGAVALPNPRGMAPPIAIELGEGRWLFVLPGIPRELTAIVETVLLPRFFKHGSAAWVVEVRYTSVPEAEMYEPMRVLEREFPDVSVGSYPQLDRREIVIRLRGSESSRVNAAAERLRQLRPERGQAAN